MLRQDQMTSVLMKFIQQEIEAAEHALGRARAALRDLTQHQLTQDEEGGG